jgi:RHS repeat-associated protein
VGNAKQKLTLYAGGGSGIGDAISRVTALSNEATRADEDEVYAAYAYNGAGRIVLETQKNAGATVAELDYYQSTTPDTYDGFDRFGRVVDQKWVHGATVLDRYGYGYDRNSNRLYRENVLAADRSEVYDYDMLDRLAGMDRGTLNEQKTAIAGTPAREETWNLNQTGNWAGYHVKTDGAAVLDQTRTNNKANEITGIETAPEQTQWVEPEYDARGNMITVPKPNSPASAFTCTWDAWNRLIQVKDGETVVATYRYDGLTRRIQKLLGPDPENPTTTYDYYHNSARQILETRKNGDTDPYEQHVWGLRYVHSPVCRFYDPDTDGQNIQTHYYCNDANFNVTALVDTGGNVVERYTYAPYGKVTFRAADWSERASSVYANDVLYTGHRLDTETGLYYGGWRYYHPTLGLWTSRDPGGYSDGMSLYEYVYSMPLNAWDATGNAGVKIETEYGKTAPTTEGTVKFGPFEGTGSVGPEGGHVDFTMPLLSLFNFKFIDRSVASMKTTGSFSADIAVKVEIPLDKCSSDTSPFNLAQAAKVITVAYVVPVGVTHTVQAQWGNALKVQMIFGYISPLGLADFIGLDVKAKGKFLVPGEKLVGASWMPPNNLCNKACCYEVAVQGQVGFQVYGYTALFKVTAAGAVLAVTVAMPAAAAEVGAEILIATPAPALIPALAG